MKPINDNVRKAAMAKAGFFTLIPMLLVGCLVWTGMKGHEENINFIAVEDDNTKEELKERDFFLKAIKEYQDSLSILMKRRKANENNYFNAFEADPLDVANEEGDLLEAERALESYLNNSIKTLEQIDQFKIAAEINRLNRNELKLHQKVRKAKVDNSVDIDNDDRVKELEMKVEDYQKEIEDLEEGANNSERIINDKSNDINTLNDKIRNLKNEKINLINILRGKLNEDGCKAPAWKKCYQNKMREIKEFLDAKG